MFISLQYFFSGLQVINRVRAKQRLQPLPATFEEVIFPADLTSYEGVIYFNFNLYHPVAHSTFQIRLRPKYHIILLLDNKEKASKIKPLIYLAISTWHCEQDLKCYHSLPVLQFNNSIQWRRPHLLCLV